jgi:hypothetical protein
MLGKLTDDTLRRTPGKGGLSQETLAQVEALGANPEVGYRAYRIRPTPKELRGGGWTIEGLLVRDHGGHVREQVYSARSTYATRAEAVAWAIQLGQDIIDRNVPGLSI